MLCTLDGAFECHKETKPAPIEINVNLSIGFDGSWTGATFPWKLLKTVPPTPQKPKDSRTPEKGQKCKIWFYVSNPISTTQGWSGLVLEIMSAMSLMMFLFILTGLQGMFYVKEYCREHSLFQRLPILSIWYYIKHKYIKLGLSF